MKGLRQFIIRLIHPLIPFALVLLLTKTVKGISDFLDSWHSLLLQVPLWLLFIGVLLSWRFMKSNRIFIALILGSFYITVMPHDQILPTFLQQFLVSMPQITFQGSLEATDPRMFLLLPMMSVNLLLFSWVKERGFWTFWGRIKILCLLIQGLSVVWIGIRFPTWFQQGIRWQMPWSFDGVWTFLPHGALLVMGIVIFVFVVRLFLRPTCLLHTLLITILLLPTMATTTPIKAALSGCVIGGLLVISILHESYEMAYIDELTQIPSRRALEASMLKLGGTYSIAMLDIDFFKKFNDRHGHDIGDDVLAMVARTLYRNAGKGSVFRYGGEEFTVLFPNQSLEQVKPQLEQLRLLVSQQTLTKKPSSKNNKRKKGNSKATGQKLRVTISVGASEKNAASSTPEMVRTEADKALYSAKKKGRNCVSVKT